MITVAASDAAAAADDQLLINGKSLSVEPATRQAAAAARIAIRCVFEAVYAWNAQKPVPHLLLLLLLLLLLISS